MMQLYYVHNLEESRAIGDETEARHLNKVMRKHVGDLAFITPGNGQLWHAEILSLSRSAVIFKPLKMLREDKKPARLAIAVGPTKKSARIEDLVLKGVELGLTDLFLIQTDRTLRKDFKTKRLKAQAISAMKQSQRTHLLSIHEMMDFDHFLAEVSPQFEGKYIGKLEGASAHLINCSLNRDVLVLIGPEGDFSDSEFEKASASDFQAITLGTYRLRTETAGLMAIATIANKRQLDRIHV